MLRIAVRSLTAHKLRSLLTTLAILLGVAMISGTYVLTDQIERGFNEIFADAYQGIDATVSREQAFSGGQMVGAAEGLPATLVDEVREVEGVAVADGYVNGVGAVAVNGEVVQTGGAPTLFFSVSEETIDNSTSYIAGGRPTEPGQVAIIEKLATDQGLRPGSELTVITDDGSQEVTVVGVFQFGAQASLGGALIVQSTLDDARRWFGMEGRVSQIDIQATPGTAPETLVERIRDVLPEGTLVQTGEQAAADQTRAVSEAIGQFLRPALLAFGGIAVLVGAFIIFNAFSMTVAQRRREFAMLRALGASRRQVLISITGEALVMGIVASLIGLVAGFGVAAGVNAVFTAVGIDIPRSGLIMEPRTVAIAMGVGIGVTLLSAIVPAQRATRVPPIAALQEGAVLPPSRFARYTSVLAAAVGALGIVLIVLGMYGSGDTTTRLGTLAAGAVLVFVAVALVSKYFVGPVAAVLGWPLERFSSISGRLARDNAQRNPSRTAATASALMIGLGVVVFVAVFAQGLKSSFIDGFDRMVTGDYVISGANYLTLPVDTARRVQSVPSVDVATPLVAQQVQANGDRIVPLYGVDPSAFRRVWNFEWLGEADDTAFSGLDAEAALLEEQTAETLGVAVGDTVRVATMEGREAELEVRGVYRDPIMLNGMLVTQSGYASLFPRPQVFMVIVSAAAGADAAQTRQSIEAALADTPTAEVRSNEEYKDTIVGLVNQLLNLLYGLLALSVIISLFGIVNTLVLSVYERTREIGLLRAIGSSRSQVGSTVRYESVITSIMGGVMGIVIGTIFAYVVTMRFGGQGITFSIPVLQLIVFFVLAILVGVIAAILPARRAARIDILDAIHYE
jgi:putative ABC transport system permease protein